MKKLLKLLIESQSIIYLNGDMTRDFIKNIGPYVHCKIESNTDGTYGISIFGIKKKAKQWTTPENEEMGVIDQEPAEPNLLKPKEYKWPHEEAIAYLIKGEIESAIFRHSRTIGGTYGNAQDELLMWFKEVIDRETVVLWASGKKLDALKSVHNKGLGLGNSKHLCEKYCPYLVDGNNNIYFYDEMKAEEFERFFSLFE